MLINNDTYQRETLSERPIRQPLSNCLTPTTPVFGEKNEMSILEDFHPDWTILFRSNPPECVLNTIPNYQLIETIKLWYLHSKLQIFKNKS